MIKCDECLTPLEHRRNQSFYERLWSRETGGIWIHGIETYYCPNCKCECPSIPCLSPLAELWRQDKTQKHFYFRDGQWSMTPPSDTTETDAGIMQTEWSDVPDAHKSLGDRRMQLERKRKRK